MSPKKAKTDWPKILMICQDGTIKNAKSGRVLSYFECDRGYRTVSIQFKKEGPGSNYQKWAVHRLVAGYFCKNEMPLEKTCVNHIDCDPRNNHSSNLEWVTSKENAQHTMKTGRARGIFKGDLSDDQALTIMAMNKFCTKMLGRHYGRAESSGPRLCYAIRRSLIYKHLRGVNEGVKYLVKGNQAPKKPYGLDKFYSDPRHLL